MSTGLRSPAPGIIGSCELPGVGTGWRGTGWRGDWLETDFGSSARTVSTESSLQPLLHRIFIQLIKLEEVNILIFTFVVFSIIWLLLSFYFKTKLYHWFPLSHKD